MAEKRLIKSPDISRPDRIPPGQVVTGSWPVLHHGDVQDTDTSRWTFTISGLVAEETAIGFDEFMALPRVEVLSDVHCVTGWSMLDNLWEGVSTSLLKELVRIDPAARHVLVHASGGFATNIPVEEFFREDVLFAIKHNGELLDLEHGYPARLVVPGLYFWKSAKWVCGVEFLEEDVRGFWESRGYHNHGDPWKEERFGP